MCWILFHFQYTILSGLNRNPLNFEAHIPITFMFKTGILSSYKITEIKHFIMNIFLINDSKILKLIKK